jgi:hypothetical protein
MRTYLMLDIAMVVFSAVAVTVCIRLVLGMLGLD